MRAQVTGLVAFFTTALLLAACGGSEQNELAEYLKGASAKVEAAKASGDEIDLTVACAEALLDLEKKQAAIAADPAAKAIADRIGALCDGVLEDDLGTGDPETAEPLPATGSPLATGAPALATATPPATADRTDTAAPPSPASAEAKP